MFRRILYTKIKVKYLVFLIILVITLNVFGVFTHLFEKNFYTEFHYPYDGDIRNSVQQLKYGEKSDIPPINSYNYNFSKNCSTKCKTEEKIRIVILVKSSPNHFNRRIAIRSSWGYEHRFSDVEVRTLFLLGLIPDENLQNLVDSEHQRFNDIVQANFMDSYFNNTIKTMMGFKWAVNFCSNSKFYMFVDDDYYVSLKNVLRFLRNPSNYPKYLKEPIASLKNVLINRERRQIDFELPNDIHLYTGYVFVSSPHRHLISKWHVSLEEYPYHMWPPYVTAGAYILSREALLDMYFTSFYTKHFRFDDIYLGLLAHKAKIEPFHSDEFYFYKKSYSPKEYTFVIASHGFDDPGEMLRIWTEQKSLGNA